MTCLLRRTQASQTPQRQETQTSSRGFCDENKPQSPMWDESSEAGLFQRLQSGERKQPVVTTSTMILNCSTRAADRFVALLELKVPVTQSAEKRGQMKSDVWLFLIWKSDVESVDFLWKVIYHFVVAVRNIFNRSSAKCLSSEVWAGLYNFIWWNLFLPLRSQ